MITISIDFSFGDTNSTKLHKLAPLTNVSTRASPYGKQMYNRDCPRQIRVLNEHEKAKLLSNGQMYVDQGTGAQIFSRGFCLENFFNPDTGQVYMSAFLCMTENASETFPSPQQNSSECKFEGDIDGLHRNLRSTFTYCGLISLFFIFLSLFFYLTLPDLCNFQGKIMCAYISSTGLTTVFLMVIYNIKMETGPETIETEFFIVVSERTCQALGYLLYCSGLLMFTWMSVLCFDLFR